MISTVIKVPGEALTCMSDPEHLLLIADISGYTPFMRLHAMSLAHAQDIVSDLIDGLIDASGVPFELCKVEGDAAFLYAPISVDDDLSSLLDSVMRMQRAFHGMRREVAQNTVCLCDACQQASALRVKFVVHLGPVRMHRHRGLVDLAGFEVVVAHRLLKVQVPAREYLLATQAVLARMPKRSSAARLVTELAGIGRAELGYFELPACRAEVEGTLPLWLRWKISLRRTWRTLPLILGMQEPCAGFRNVVDAGIARTVG